MKIVGHTMGTPELSLLEAIDLFADRGLDGIEIVRQQEVEQLKKIIDQAQNRQCLKSLAEETA